MAYVNTSTLEGVDKASDYGNYAFSVDAREAAKLDAFTPRAQGDERPWWERVAEYGLTRAIDAEFGPAATNKTDAPATFAGQNGRTYSQVGNTSQAAANNSGANWLPLALAAGVAFLALG